MLSISLTWLNILHTAGEKQFVPRTYIHSCPNNMLQINRVWASKVFFSASSFAPSLHLIVTKKEPTILLLILKGNLIRHLKRITNLNFHIWKRTNWLYFKSSGCISTGQQFFISGSLLCSLGVFLPFLWVENKCQKGRTELTDPPLAK